MPLGRPATMPAKMMSEMPLPMPRAVICSPSHIRNTVPPVSVMTVDRRKNMPGSDDQTGLPFQADRDAIGLQRGQEHGAVAGVLVDLLAALLAFLLQLLRDAGDTVVISWMMIEAEM